MLSLTDEVLQYHQQAATSDQAQQWFQSRGLTAATVDRFKLGWITEPVSREATKYVGSAVIPYLTLSGKAITAKLRLFNRGIKYLPLRSEYPLAQPGRHLFNASAAMPTTRRRAVAVVEGEVDAMVVHQAGVKAVAIPGVEAFYEPWSWLFTDAEPIIAFDGDEAGQQGAQKLAGILQRRGVSARVECWPEGIDANDFYLRHGAQRLRQHLGVD